MNLKAENKGGVLPVVLVLAAAAMWGCIGIFVKYLNAKGMTSIQITTIRCLVNALLMLVLILATDKCKLKIDKKDIGWFLANGICSIYVFNTAYQASISLTSMSTAVALLYTSPVFVLLFSVIFFRERLTAVKGISALLSIIGSALVSGIIGGFVVNAAGIGLGLLSGLGYAFYSIFSTVILRKYHPFTNIFYTFLIAGVMGIFTCDIGVLSVILSDGNTLIVALFNGIVTGFLAYTCYTVGLSKMRASKAAVLASLEPVVATALSIIIYHDNPGVSGIIGICMVVGAIILQNVNIRREKAC